MVEIAPATLVTLDVEHVELADPVTENDGAVAGLRDTTLPNNTNFA
jgi:hypothetical protein